MISLPVLVTADLTFDTRSLMLVKGELAIVLEIEPRDGEGDGWNKWEWTLMSVDRPRIIKHTFCSRPERVFKSWLIPVVA